MLTRRRDNPTECGPADKALAERIMHIVDSRGSLVLDRNGLSEIGANRRKAMRAVYDLAMSERVQLRADPGGLMEVVSNAEFVRLLQAEAGKTSVPLADAAPASVDDDVPADIMDTETYLAEAAASCPEYTGEFVPEFSPEAATYLTPALPEIKVPAATVAIVPFGAVDTPVELIPTVLPVQEGELANASLEWFAIDVAPPEADSAVEDEKVPLSRQSLPPRKRDPWISLEDAVLDSE